MKTRRATSQLPDSPPLAPQAVHCAALNAGAREVVQTPEHRSKRRALETPSRVLRQLFSSGKLGDTSARGGMNATNE